MTGLGDVSYTGPPDPNESELSPTNDRTFAISIVASDVTLDGLTITGILDRSCYYGVYIYPDSSPLTNIKVTNCVIRHFLYSDIYNYAIGLTLFGYS